MVFVEIDPQTEMPIRILKHYMHACQLEPSVVRQMAKSVAVGYIRQQVVDRARRGSCVQCEFCGNLITESTGHMHEFIPKGKGGEVSVENSRFICPACHIGPDGEHSDRQWGGRREGYAS